MTHQNLVQQVLGSPGSQSDVGNGPATKGDLLAAEGALNARFLNLPDPFAHRQITNADILNLRVTDAEITSLSVSKLTAGTLAVAANVGSSQVTIDGTTNLISIKDSTPTTRVKLGNLGSDYGLEVYNSAGTKMWSATSGATSSGIGSGAVATLSQFASSIRPVAIVSSLPALPDSTYPQGATVVLTTDNKLYRSTGTAWTTTTPTTDLTGTVTNTQIADDSISTPKLQANVVTAAKIAANTITAGQIAANTITASQIAADTLTAGQIAAGAIASSELAAGSVIAGKMDVGALSAAFILSGSIATSSSNPKVILDTSTLSVFDSGATRRVKVGNLGADYGMEIYNSSGTLMWSATSGAQTAGIGNNQVTDGKINDLAVGKLTAGSLTVAATLSGSGVVQTSSGTGARLTIDVNDIKAFDSSNRKTFDISFLSGSSQVNVVRSDGLDNILSDSYSATAADGARAVFRRSRGSISSPAQILSGDNIAEVVGVGYTSGSAFSGSVAGMVVQAAENFTGSAQGTNISFYTVQKGTTGYTSRVQISDRGMLGLAADATSPDSGVLALGGKASGAIGGVLSSQAKIYLTGSKLVVQYLDGATTRFKSLDLSGTGTLWAHSTSAP